MDDLILKKIFYTVAAYNQRMSLKEDNSGLKIIKGR